jgi:hypothetical protein
MKSYKPKTVSKKQQLADQHRREKVLTDTPLYRVGAMHLRITHLPVHDSSTPEI